MSRPFKVGDRVWRPGTANAMTVVEELDARRLRCLRDGRDVPEEWAESVLYPYVDGAHNRIVDGKSVAIDGRPSPLLINEPGGRERFATALRDGGCYWMAWCYAEEFIRARGRAGDTVTVTVHPSGSGWVVTSGREVPP